MNRKLPNFDILCKMADKEYRKNGKTEFFDSLAKKVIENGRPEENYFFARDVKGADPIAHGKPVIESMDVEYNYLYGLDVYGCDHDAHIEVLFKLKEFKLAQKLRYEHTPICEL